MSFAARNMPAVMWPPNGSLMASASALAFAFALCIPHLALAHRFGAKATLMRATLRKSRLNLEKKVYKLKWVLSKNMSILGIYFVPIITLFNISQNKLQNIDIIDNQFISKIL